MRCKRILAAMAAPALFGASGAVNAAEHEIESYQFDNSATLLSDQRTRSISDSLMKPALKLSTVFAHESGLVAIADLVNVSKVEFPSGNGLDLTVAGGYRFGNPEGWHFGIGLAAEIFPGAKYNAPHAIDLTDPNIAVGFRDTSISSRFAVLEINYGEIEGRILEVISPNYRGADTGTVCGPLLDFAPDPMAALLDPNSKLNTCYARGDHDSRGTLLYDLDYKITVMPATTLKLHAGYQKVKNFAEADLTDYSVGVTHKHWGFEWTAEYMMPRLKTRELAMYRDGGEVKQADNDKLVLSVSRHF